MIPKTAKDIESIRLIWRYTFSNKQNFDELFDRDIISGVFFDVFLHAYVKDIEINSLNDYLTAGASYYSDNPTISSQAIHLRNLLKQSNPELFL